MDEKDNNKSTGEDKPVVARKASGNDSMISSSQLAGDTGNIAESIAKFEDLWDKGDVVRKHSVDRRKVFEEFTNLLSERSVIELEYAKNIQRIAASMKKLVQSKGDISNMIALYSSDLQVRVQQSMSLADNLKEYVSDYLKQILKEQEEYAKAVFSDGKKLEKDLQYHLENIEKTRLRYLKAKREFDDMQVMNQIYLLTSSVPSDKKDKHKLKVSQTEREVQEFKFVFQEALENYNSFIEMFYPEQWRIMQDLHKQEEERCEGMHDGILKLLMFETSFFKNIEYQVNLLSQTIASCDLSEDARKFVSLNCSNKPLYKKIAYEQFVSFVDCSMQRINSQQTTKGAGGGAVGGGVSEKDIEIFVKKSIEDKQSVGMMQPANDKLMYVVDIVIRAWNDKKIASEEYTMFQAKTLEDIDFSNHFAYVLQQFRIKNKFTLTARAFQAIAYLISCSLNGCFKFRDSKFSRQLLVLSFTYYTEQRVIRETAQMKEEVLQSNEEKEQQSQKSSGGLEDEGKTQIKEKQDITEEKNVSLEMKDKNGNLNDQSAEEEKEEQVGEHGVDAQLSNNQTNQDTSADAPVPESEKNQVVNSSGEDNNTSDATKQISEENNDKTISSQQQQQPNIQQQIDPARSSQNQQQLDLPSDSSSSSSSSQPTLVEKSYLYSQIIHHHLWKSRDFWEAAIFDSAYEELKDGMSLRQHESQKESIMRERNSCFGQLISLLQNMLLFEIDKKEIRFLLQKFAKLFNLTEDQLKSLNLTIDQHVYSEISSILQSSSSQSTSFSN